MASVSHRGSATHPQLPLMEVLGGKAEALALEGRVLQNPDVASAWSHRPCISISYTVCHFAESTVSAINRPIGRLPDARLTMRQSEERW